MTTASRDDVDTRRQVANLRARGPPTTWIRPVATRTRIEALLGCYVDWLRCRTLTMLTTNGPSGGQFYGEDIRPYLATSVISTNQSVPLGSAGETRVLAVGVADLCNATTAWRPKRYLLSPVGAGSLTRVWTSWPFFPGRRRSAVAAAHASHAC